MNKKKLLKARSKIDLIDNKIFNLIVKRTRIVKYMLSLKTQKKHIVDRKRMNQIFKNIKSKSIKKNIDHKITLQIWKSMIWSYIDFQKRIFKRK